MNQGIKTGLALGLGTVGVAIGLVIFSAVLPDVFTNFSSILTATTYDVDSFIAAGVLIKLIPTVFIIGVIAAISGVAYGVYKSKKGGM